MIATSYGKLPIVVDPTTGRARLVREDKAANSGSQGRMMESRTPSPARRSKLEQAYGSFLELEQRAGAITAFWHEPFSFKLADGKRYRPDYLVLHLDGRTECVEVKGYHANIRDSLTHLAWAAQRFPFHVWRRVWRTKDGGWDGKSL